MANQKETPEKNPKKATKTDVIQPLPVSITFVGITGLKLPIALDDKGHLVVGVQFQARVDPFEVFRLINLMNQPNGGLSATISSPQSSMDFRFDPKAGTVEVLKSATPVKPDQVPAAKNLNKPKKNAGQEPAAAAEPPAPDIALIELTGISFNHIPEEERPYGVTIDFLNGDGQGEHCVAGRGGAPTEAIMDALKQTKGFDPGLDEPFQYIDALKLTKKTPAQIKVIRAIEVGSFDDKGDAKPSAEGK